jgi:hypothetical protein
MPPPFPISSSSLKQSCVCDICMLCGGQRTGGVVCVHTGAGSGKIMDPQKRKRQETRSASVVARGGERETSSAVMSAVSSSLCRPWEGRLLELVFNLLADTFELFVQHLYFIRHGRAVVHRTCHVSYPVKNVQIACSQNGSATRKYKQTWTTVLLLLLPRSSRLLFPK